MPLYGSIVGNIRMFRKPVRAVSRGRPIVSRKDSQRSAAKPIQHR